MKAIIEMPKGDTRRRHIRKDGVGFVDLGPIKNIIPINDGSMPVHYGFIPETLNKNEGDEIDILVISDKVFTIGQEVDVRPIALIKREDKDDKIVAIDQSIPSIQEWSDISKKERKRIENFFGYHHAFVSIENAEAAIRYVENGYQQFLKMSEKK